jgi:Cu2+-exporting ATPase
VEGERDTFCCTGCEVAAAIIAGAGLERYYAERTDYAPRPDPLPAGDWSQVPVTATAEGTCEARLVVDGLRCASCVWVTEKVLERTPGVARATVSYATGRATLRWDPARIDLAGIARRIAALGYRPRPLTEAATPDRGLMVRAAFAAVATLAIMGLYEGLYAGWWYGTIDPLYAQLFRWTSLALATPVTLWAAEPFFTGAWAGLRHRVLHMDLPVALGVAILYLHGLVMTVRAEDSYLDSLAMLVALLLLGRVLESRGRRRAAEAAGALVGSVPRVARRVVRDEENAEGGAQRVETVPVSALRPGDWIDAGAGEEFAADGVVKEGSGQVRLALLTGEAAPVLVGPGDRVVAGTLLLDGALTVEVEAVGPDTVIHRMAAELQAAQDRGLRPSSTDRIAPWFTAATLVAALGTFIGWWLLRDAGSAVTATVAVLVVACPCARALAEPLAAAAGLGAAARRGLLLRSGDALLRLGQANLAALDKTGTVTAGAIAVTEAADDVLRIAAGLERYSAHPIARAITAEAAARGIPLPEAREIVETPGLGISGIVDGRRWALVSAGPGSVRLCPTEPETLDEEEGQELRLGDTVRPDAAAAIASLGRLGLRTALLTGDHEAVAHRIAREAGVTLAAARVDPAAKAAWIRARQAEGQVVLFAGDGLNDGPALAAANVGIAMAGGAASSVLVADGIIGTGSLRPLAAGIRASRAAARMVRSSQVQSILYNILAVAAAMAGLVNPLVAAVLMPLSSGVVLWNAAHVERIVTREERCAP